MKSELLKSVVFNLSGLIFMQHIQCDLQGSSHVYSYLFIIIFIIIHKNDVVGIINKLYIVLLCSKKNKKLQIEKKEALS